MPPARQGPPLLDSRLRGNDGWLTVVASTLLLASCNTADQTPNTQAIAAVEQQAQTEAEDDGRVLCARGKGALTRSCTVDRTEEDSGLVLTVRYPDGAFRRLAVTDDGRGVREADGAERAAVQVVGNDEIEVAVGDDRIRLPATVKQ
jgi:hypothetical protein